MDWFVRMFSTIFGNRFFARRTAIEENQREEINQQGNSISESTPCEDSSTTDEQNTKSDPSSERNEEKPKELTMSGMSSSVVAISREAAFPVYSLPEATTGSIEKDGKVFAKQTLVKYSPNQAYCVVSEFDTALEDNEILVKEDKENPLELTLVSIEEEKINKHLLPIFVRFHHPLKQRSAESHLSDRVFESSLGRTNLELKKNVTMDSFERFSSWRDEAGFVVSDRHQYTLATFDSKKIAEELMPAETDVAVYSSADLEALLDFDHSVCGANRQSLIERLTDDSQVLLIKTTCEVNGMLAGKGERIFALYAETIELAHSLIKHYIEKNKLKQVTFFTRSGVWQTVPEQSRPVYRYHTRSVPAQLKWNKIYAANFGVHLV